MKKPLRNWMLGLSLIALYSGATAFGAELTPKQAPKPGKLQPTVEKTETQPVWEAVLGQAPASQPAPLSQFGIVHAEPQKVLAPSVPNPGYASNLAPAPRCSEPACDPGKEDKINAEIERLAAEIAKLKKDMPKKPDTKKGWSAPKVSGRVFLESVAVNQNDDSRAMQGNMQNAAGVREFQLAVTGTGYDSFDYKIELGLPANYKNPGQVTLVDNWIGVKNMPLLGYVRGGHFKPETGLQYPASALYTTLMEFTEPSSAFGSGRRFGVASENLFWQDRLRFSIGYFQDGATNYDRCIWDDHPGQLVNLRLSAAPIFAEQGRKVLHLGGHYQHFTTKNGTTSINASPAALALLDPTVTSGTFACKTYNRGGLEFAFQKNGFNVQSELFVSAFDGSNGGPGRHAYGAYVETKYFLTKGDYRTYDLNKGAFGAAKIKHNFHPFKCGDWNLIDGWGGWELVAQWSYLDLDDWRDHPASNGKAGTQNDLTFGVNWFWNPNIRWIFQYTRSMQNLGVAHNTCAEDIFGTSLRLHF